MFILIISFSFEVSLVGCPKCVQLAYRCSEAPLWFVRLHVIYYCFLHSLLCKNNLFFEAYAYSWDVGSSNVKNVTVKVEQ